RMPVMMARAGFTLLEARAQKLMQRYKLTLPQMFVDKEKLNERIGHALVPATLEETFNRESAGVLRHLDRVRAELEKFDPTLAASVEKSRAKVVYQLEKARLKTANEIM